MVVLTYEGTERLSRVLNVSADVLSEVILNPPSYSDVWSRAREWVGGHDYHDLQWLHDTLCFIHERGGRIPTTPTPGNRRQELSSR